MAGSGVKHSLDMQIEECRRVIDDLPVIEGKHQRKSKIVFRQDIMRSVCRTLDWVKQNEPHLRAWVQAEKDKSIVNEIVVPEEVAPKPKVGALSLLVELGWCKPTRLFINDFKPTEKCPLGMPIVEANPRTEEEAQILLSEIGGKLKQSKTDLHRGGMQWHVEDTQAVELMRQLVARSMHPYKKVLAQDWIGRWK